MVRKAIVTFCSVSLHQAKLPPSLFLNSNNNKNKLFKYIVIVDVSLLMSNPAKNKYLMKLTQTFNAVSLPELLDPQYFAVLSDKTRMPNFSLT